MKIAFFTTGFITGALFMILWAMKRMIDRQDKENR